MTVTEAAKTLEKHLGSNIDKTEARLAAESVRMFLDGRKQDEISEYLLDRVEQIESNLSR